MGVRKSQTNMGKLAKGSENKTATPQKPVAPRYIPDITATKAHSCDCACNRKQKAKGRLLLGSSMMILLYLVTLASYTFAFIVTALLLVEDYRVLEDPNPQVSYFRGLVPCNPYLIPLVLFFLGSLTFILDGLQKIYVTMGGKAKKLTVNPYAVVPRRSTPIEGETPV